MMLSLLQEAEVLLSFFARFSDAAGEDKRNVLALPMFQSIMIPCYSNLIDV
ncbi:hypothetical protein HYU19_03545 [Candidatus Woesearchaeota archaeon]|nr:hypothetical protein [Candidatus Woesearchaeota archaeon]